MKLIPYTISLLFFCLAASAAEYSAYTTDALLKLRTTLTSPQEKRLVHQELQKRLPQMSNDELERYLRAPKEQRGRGMGDGRIETH